MNPRRRANHARAIALAVIVVIAPVLSGQQAPLANQAGPVRFLAPPAGFIGERLTLVGVGLGRSVQITVHDVPALVLATFEGFGGSTDKPDPLGCEN